MSRTKFLLWMMAMTALHAGCSPSPDDTGQAEPEARLPEEDMLTIALARITEKHLQAHVRYLAADERKGRMTGTPGYGEAAAYVADQLEQIGLSPGGEQGWYQEVPLKSAHLDVDSATVILHPDGSDRRLAWKEDFVMFGDDVRKETNVRAPVVFAGFGVHAPDMNYSDLENVDVSGKIVAIFLGAPPSFPHNQRAFYSSTRVKLRELVSRGAVGIIAMRSRVDRQRYTWEQLVLNVGTQPGMAWVDPSGQVEGYFPRIRGLALVDVEAARTLFEGAPVSYEEALDAADAGRQLSAPLGVEVTLARRTRHEEVTSPNVIGIAHGSDPELREEYVVYSAHLDHVGTGQPVDGDRIYNGFYDNAMGVALMIEAARAIVSMPERPRRSVLFIAVTGEERGLLGSDYFAHYPTVPPQAIVADVNLDMPLFLYPLADVIAFGAEHSSLESVIETAVAAEDFTLSPDPIPEEVLFIRSDQYSFVRQGVPSVFLVPGFTSTDADVDGAALFQQHLHQHYHRPSDDLSQPVDWESALRFARANVRIGLAIADHDGRPTWNEGDFFGARFGRQRLDGQESNSPAGGTPEAR